MSKIPAPYVRELGDPLDQKLDSIATPLLLGAFLCFGIAFGVLAAAFWL